MGGLVLVRIALSTWEPRAEATAAGPAWKRIAFCLSLLAMLGGAWEAGAWDPEGSFRQGIQAADEGDWQEAISHFQTAIGRPHGSSKKKVRIYGMRYERYQPNYHLGRALFHLGNCSGALRALLAAESTESLGRLQESNLQEWRRGCGQAATPRPPSRRKIQHPSRPRTRTPNPPSSPKPSANSPAIPPVRKRPKTSSRNQAPPTTSRPDETSKTENSRRRTSPIPKNPSKGTTISRPKRTEKTRPPKAPPPTEPLPPGELGTVARETRRRLDRMEAVVDQLESQEERDSKLQQSLLQARISAQRLREELDDAIKSNDLPAARRCSREANTALRAILALETELNGWTWEGR